MSNCCCRRRCCNNRCFNNCCNNFGNCGGGFNNNAWFWLPLLFFF
ncbi:hypothetical protein [Clostridium sp. YIM B02555]|nr:hypothetical protein [Clostridium sp. YIM B02555]